MKRPFARRLYSCARYVTKRTTWFPGLLLLGTLANAFPVTDCEQRPNKPADTPAASQVAAKLNTLRKCATGTDDRTACNVFLGKALEILFGNTDFKAGTNSFFLANDIVNGLEVPGNSGWKKIGQATEQSSLDKAAQLANSGKPVIAARIGRRNVDGSIGAGHVALIIPGALEVYAFDGFGWGSLKTPSAASFFIDKPDRLFVGCPLSAVWLRPDGVTLYYKP